ncbi:HEAT repeat domain-containing protein [Myxococcus sp. SDU36]|uniref:HEAT repeat domain-containing protein n=1 Tax=Myxococcus sp. SDU36 TaxID=2831967 RepID=UPI002543E0B8|nr:HEAT repeat domain-containing protein [Myxococcus sp. SDU36]
MPGSEYRYSLDVTQQVAFKQPQPQGDAPPSMRFHLQGEWRVGIVSANDARVDARVSLLPESVSVDIEGHDALSPEQRQLLMGSLSLPFFVTLERTGAARLVHMETGTDVLAQGLLRSVVAATQFVVQGVPGAGWQSEEHDATGQYNAAYRRAEEPLRFSKSKLAYTHVATAQGLQPLAKDKLRIDVRTDSQFQLGADLWPESLVASEQFEVDAGDGMPRASHELRLRLLLLERSRDTSLPGALAALRDGLTTIPLASIQGHAQDPQAHHRQILGGRRFEDMLEDLRALPKDAQARDDARTLAMERLRALFVLEPAEALKVPGVLHEGLEPLAASPMLGALSAASTTESIQALSRILEDGDVSIPVRTDAVAALGMAEAPTPEGVEALRARARDTQPELRDTATLALGNAAMRMGAGSQDARGAQTLVEELGARFRSSNSVEEKALMMRALGNTRDPRALAYIEEGLREAAPQVRQAAVEALRLLSDPAVDPLLAQRLLGDPSPEVRKAVLFAVSFRPLGPLLSVLDQALRGDPSDGLRAELVQFLGSRVTTTPEVRPLLAWASQNDANASIRQAALGFLNAVSANTVP